MLDLAIFVPRLKQVMAWTAHRAKEFDYQDGNYGTVFRQLNPLIEGVPLFTIQSGYTTWNQDVYELAFLNQALQLAFEQRDAQVGEGKGDFNNFQSLGRILYFETQLTTHDGAAIVKSDCFVDESDVPPIDTWFYLDCNTSTKPHNRPNLFCWIPKPFEAVMEAAISVEMMDSYHWLDEAGPLTHQQIVAIMAG